MVAATLPPASAEPRQRQQKQQKVVPCSAAERHRCWQQKVAREERAQEKAGLASLGDLRVSTPLLRPLGPWGLEAKSSGSHNETACLLPSITEEASTLPTKATLPARLQLHSSYGGRETGLAVAAVAACPKPAASRSSSVTSTAAASTAASRRSLLQRRQRSASSFMRHTPAGQKSAGLLFFNEGKRHRPASPCASLSSASSLSSLHSSASAFALRSEIGSAVQEALRPLAQQLQQQLEQERASRERIELALSNVSKQIAS